ncbi:MAG: oligosaccharide flippase family protein [Lachnospiraceae bacterium]
MHSDKKVKYLIKNIGILTISNFASKIMVFLMVPLYTSILTTKEYGVYDLIISSVQLLIPVFTLNIIDAVMRFTIEDASNSDSSRKNEVVSIGLEHLTMSFIIVGISLVIIFITGILHSIRGLEVFVFLYYLFYTLNQFMIQLAKGLEHVMYMGIAGIIGTIAQIVGNVILLLYFELGLSGFFIANILAQALPVAYFSVRLRIWQYIKTRSARNRDKILHKEMLLYCMPLIFTTLGWWVNNAADKYSVFFIIGTASTGILSISYKIPTILNVVQSIFIQAWQISAIKEYETEDVGSFYGKTFVCLNLLMSLAASVLIILSRPLASFFYANDFYVAWKYVPFLLIAGIFNSASGFLGPVLAAAKDSKSMAKSAIYGTVSNIIFNISLVYLIGLQGATIATAISSYVIYFVRKKAVGSNIVIEKYWKVYVGWALLCVQTIIEIFSIGYFIELFIIVTIVMINWKVICGLLEKSLNIITKK